MHLPAYTTRVLQLRGTPDKDLAGMLEINMHKTACLHALGIEINPQHLGGLELHQVCNH